MAATKRDGLTVRQAQVLAFIKSTIRVSGKSPTIRAIAQHLGVSSTNGIARHLDYLELKGVLRRENGKLVLTEKP